jgi:disulfide bond formation protein DsbB
MSHVLLIFLVLVVLGRNSWGKQIYEFINKNAFLIGFLIALGAMLGSLFYSEVIGFEACVLCWWQRAFLYPLVLVFGAGFWYKKNWLFSLAAFLALAALIVGGYQEISNLTGASVLTCTDAEGACSKIFVKEFGYITIPVMSVTVALYVLVVVWIKKSAGWRIRKN